MSARGSNGRPEVRSVRVARLSTLGVTAAALAFGIVGCRDLSRFSSKGDRFEGAVVTGSFVRSGFGSDARMCLTLDTDHLQDAPGAITTSDGRFQKTPLRPIPQLWHDPLSTLSFGDGRLSNLVYASAPSAGDAGEIEAQDVIVIVSLMQNDGVEVRVIRGAPRTATEPSSAAALFGVFDLKREAGPCAF